MRRICLEGESLEAALRWLARELDVEAAERLRSAEAFTERVRGEEHPSSGRSRGRGQN
jgi:hypothetical protein